MHIKCKYRRAFAPTHGAFLIYLVAYYLLVKNLGQFIEALFLGGSWTNWKVMISNP